MKPLTIRLVLIILTISCQSSKNKEYEYIKDQQVSLYKSLDQDFLKTQNDIKAFKPLLIEELKKYYSVNEIVVIKKTLLSEKNHFNITPVFHNFHGKWQGLWTEYKEHKITKQQQYFHIWYPPHNIRGISIQKVSIYKGTQQEHSSETVAINTSSNGKIYGGVDQQAKKTKATHIGYYIDPYSLIWIARFNDSETPYYSIYYEKVDISKTPHEYNIKGIGFNYKRKSNSIINLHKKTGSYRDVSFSKI